MNKLVRLVILTSIGLLAVPVFADSYTFSWPSPAGQVRPGTSDIVQSSNIRHYTVQYQKPGTTDWINLETILKS